MRRAQTSVEYVLVISVLVLALVTIANLFNRPVGDAMRMLGFKAASAYTNGELANGS